MDSQPSANSMPMSQPNVHDISSDEASINNYELQKMQDDDASLSDPIENGNIDSRISKKALSRKESFESGNVEKLNTDFLADERCRKRGSQGFINVENCLEACLNQEDQKYKKRFSKEEAVQKLLTSTVLVSKGKCVSVDKRLRKYLPNEQELSHRLNKLLGQTRAAELAQYTEECNKLRDELGAVVRNERVKEKEKERDPYQVKPLPVLRDQKPKGYISPRQLIKNLRRSERSSADYYNIPDADMARLKNTMWRIETNNTEMVYPVSCEIRRRNRLMKATEKKQLGPGTYYVNEYYSIQQKKKMDQGKGYLNCQTERFPSQKTTGSNPNPASYGNPYDNLNKNRSGALRTIFATVQPFRKVTINSSGPDMCSYDPITPLGSLLKSYKGKFYPQNVAQQLKVLKDEPRGLVKYGYFKTCTTDTPDYTFTPKGFVDLICEKNQPKCGVFSTIDRDVYDGGPHSVRRRRPEHDKDFPGPGYYDYSDYLSKRGNVARPVATHEEEKICCVMKTQHEDPTSPAFYNERRGFKYLYKNIIGNGARSVFNSSTSRTMKDRTELFLNERLKGLNIRRDDPTENEIGN